MEIAALTSFLAPVLGSLLGDLADRARAEFGDAVWAKAQKLWRRLQPKVAENPEALAAAEKVAAAPDDRDLQADLTYFLNRIVEADPDLKRELARDWEKGPTVIVATVSAAGGVAIAGESSGNQVSTNVNVSETPTE